MAPNLFERSSSAIVPPRRFDGEVARMLEEENLEQGLSGINHPKKGIRGELPEELHVRRVVESGEKKGEDEEESPRSLRVKI